MKRTLCMLLVCALLAGLTAGCAKTPKNDPSESLTAQFTEKAVTAYDLDALGNEEGLVQMLVLLADGWVMDWSYGAYYKIEPGAIQDMPYEALSDDVFKWHPTQQQIENSGPDNVNVEMRIVYSDPDGRFIVYSPNVETPEMANIIMTPECFAEIIDEGSRVTTDRYVYFYKIKDDALKRLSMSMTLPDRAYYTGDEGDR